MKLNLEKIVSSAKGELNGESVIKKTLNSVRDVAYGVFTIGSEERKIIYLSALAYVTLC